MLNNYKKKTFSESLCIHVPLKSLLSSSFTRSSPMFPPCRPDKFATLFHFRSNANLSGWNPAIPGEQRELLVNKFQKVQ